jgi:hypothetical protein
VVKVVSNFHEQPFASRLAAMGDEAEKVAALIYEERKIALTPYGWNRPEAYMGKWSAFIRYMPDFITNDYLLETQGCGRSGKMKFKLEKIAAQTVWAEQFQLRWFLWQRTPARWAEVHHGWVSSRVGDEIAANRVGTFNDNNKAYCEINLQEEVDPVLWTYVDAPGSGVIPKDDPDAPTP